MSKISYYPSADEPLQLSDRLIGTEAPRPIPSPTPLATKNFSLGELLQLFSSNFPAASLQDVLDTGNTATQNITLTGTITSTLIKPTNIEDVLGSQGSTFQVLSKAISGVNWTNLPTYNLQQVLDVNNTATQNINLTGNITSTKIIPGEIQDGLSSIGSSGQVLSKSASGIRWITPTVYNAQNLADVLAVGNTATNNIFLTGDISATKIIPVNIQDVFSSTGGIGQVLTKTSSGIAWTNAISPFLSLTVTGSSGPSTLISGVLNVPTYTLNGLGGQPLSINLTSLSNLTYSSNSFVKMTASGTFSLDTNTYLTGITSSDVTTALGYTPVPTSRTLSINGISYDLSANRSWTISTSTSPLTTKGDLYTYSTADTRLPIGLDTQVLIADSTQPTGLKWGSNTAPTPLGYYGQFFDYNNQNATINNVGVPMIFGTPDIANGISVVSDGTNLTKITFANTGKYNLQFSTQFENLSNAPQDVFIWLRKNGTTTAADVYGSTGTVGMEPRKNPGDPYHTIVTWNFLLDIIAGDFYQIVWATTDIANVGIRFNAGTVNYPSTASTLFTVTQQAGIMAGTGITAINSLTGAAQTLTTGTSGTDFNISSLGTTHTFNIPDASETARGLVTTGAQTLAGAKTFSTAPILSSLTASQLLALDASKNIQSLDVATYPSLTELSYVKGVTSAIQTQLNGKQPTLSLTSGYIPKATGVSTLGDSLIQDNGTTLGIGTISTTNRLSISDTVLAGSGSLAGSLLNLTQTFNTTGIPSAIKLNVTDTLSSPNSLLLDLQVAGTSAFSVGKTGVLNWGNSITNAAKLGAATTNTGASSIRGNALLLLGDGRAFVGYDIYMNNGNSARIPTSGINGSVMMNPSFAPITGSGEFNSLTLLSTINQTGGASGTTRGLYVNPTLTSAVDFRAIETVQGKVIHIDTVSASGGTNAGSLLDLRQTWNTTGTPSMIKGYATNTASGTNSYLLDLGVGTQAYFQVRKDGLCGVASFSSYVGNSLVITGGNTASRNWTNIGTASINTATSTVNCFNSTASFTTASGAAVHNTFQDNGTINQTGTATGITRGLYINPTLTSAVDYRGIDVARGSIVLPYQAASATYAIKTSDYLVDFTSGTFPATLPTAVGCTGKTYVLKNSGTGVITIGTTSSQTIDGSTTASLGTQYETITVVSNGANWIKI